MLWLIDKLLLFCTCYVWSYYELIFVGNFLLKNSILWIKHKQMYKNVNTMIHSKTIQFISTSIATDQKYICVLNVNSWKNKIQ